MMFVFEAIESFRFDDENDHEYEISFKVFSRIVKKYTPRNSSLYLFLPDKLTLLTLLTGLKPVPIAKW